MQLSILITERYNFMESFQMVDSRMYDANWDFDYLPYCGLFVTSQL